MLSLNFKALFNLSICVYNIQHFCLPLYIRSTFNLSSIHGGRLQIASPHPLRSSPAHTSLLKNEGRVAWTYPHSQREPDMRSLNLVFSSYHRLYLISFESTLSWEATLIKELVHCICREWPALHIPYSVKYCPCLQEVGEMEMFCPKRWYEQSAKNLGIFRLKSHLFDAQKSDKHRERRTF